MRIAITADLHWGHNRTGDDATRLMRESLEADPPDVLLLGGDNGTDAHFEECLQLFEGLPSRKALVPGNHDLWVTSNDPRGDSLCVYEHHLPALCRQYGYHYLDEAPLLLPEDGLAIVGSINWYDYSWSLDRMKAEIPNWEWHLSRKAFTRGRHNDGRFVVWPTDDEHFTRRVVAALETQLEAALQKVDRAIVMTHHPAFHGLGFPRSAPAQGVDELLWEALAGNRTLETLLQKHASRIPWIFSGHIHRSVKATLGPSRGINIGGDYHFKQLVLIDWPEGTLETRVFGDPERKR